MEVVDSSGPQNVSETPKQQCTGILQHGAWVSASPQ